MRTLTALLNTARKRRGIRFVPLLTLTLWRDRYGSSPETLTLRLSDRTLNDFAGYDWLPAVIQWGGPLGSELGFQSPSVNPLGTTVRLALRQRVAASPSVLALLRYGSNSDGYEIENADVLVQVGVLSGAAEDVVTIGRARVTSLQATREDLTLQVTGLEQALDVEDGGTTFSVPVPDWLTGKAFGVELRIDGLACYSVDIFEITDARLATLGTAKPNLREILSAIWEDDGHGSGTSPGFPDQYDGDFYMIFRDPTVFTGSFLRFFQQGSGYYFDNQSAHIRNNPPDSTLHISVTANLYAVPVPATLAEMEAWDTWPATTTLPSFTLLDTVTAPGLGSAWPPFRSDPAGVASVVIPIGSTMGVAVRPSQWGVLDGFHISGFHDEYRYNFFPGIEIS